MKQESISRNPRCSICLDRLDITVPEEAAGCWLDNQVLVDGVSWGQSLVCSPGRDVLQRGGGDLLNSLHFSTVDFDGVVVLESHNLLSRLKRLISSHRIVVLLLLTDLDFDPFLGLNWIVIAELLGSEGIGSPELENQICHEDQGRRVKVVSHEGKDTPLIIGRLQDHQVKRNLEGRTPVVIFLMQGILLHLRN